MAGHFCIWVTRMSLGTGLGICTGIGIRMGICTGTGIRMGVGPGRSA